MIRNVYHVITPLWLVMRSNCKRMARFVRHLAQSKSRAIAHTHLLCSFTISS